MSKLTLVSYSWSGGRVCFFAWLPIVNGRPMLPVRALIAPDAAAYSLG